jgi:general secretion pathway protein I
MRPKRDSGFTLIEVLIAFAILAVTLGSVSAALSTGLSHELAAERATARVLEARSLFDRLGTDLPLAEGRLEGRMVTGETWLMTISRLNADDEIRLFEAYEVVLTVFGDNGPVLSLGSLEVGG